MGGMVQEEDIIKGRDHAEGHYKRVKGRGGARGHYKREGSCRRAL